MTEEQLYEKTLELAESMSAEKRGRLIGELARGLAQSSGRSLSDEEFDKEWGPILKDRLEGILSGQRKTVPWEEIRKELREKRERRRQAT